MAASTSGSVYSGLLYVPSYLHAVSLLCVCAIAYRIAYRSKSTYELIPGPPSPSILAGNMLEMSTTGAGTLPLEWHKKYHGNTVVRIHGPYFAGDGLLISDPNALWKIYDANASFIRPPSQLALGEKLVGKGIFLAEGNMHHRMKRVMQPAFNAGNVNNLVPHFRTGAVALVEAWEELLDVQSSRGTSGPVSIDVFDWLGCSALDMIGSAAFGVKLGAVLRRRGAESTESISDLAKAYESVLTAMGAEETAASIFIRYSPPWIINLLMHFPHPLVKAVKHSMVSATNAAEVMIRDRMELINSGEPLTDDALTLIIKANLDQDAKLRLSESEMTAQITTILFAGHGSSAAFMSWCLYQLALRPDLQTRLREEVLANAQYYDVKQNASIFTSKNMPFFDMFIKEVMRFYPVVHFNEKMAAADTTLKLSHPLVMKDGTFITELPCTKGTIIYTDILSYNFSTEIFGSDADQFRPERWTNPITARTAPSVYAGLFNFIAGPRACLGWRFVILEAQVLLFDLVRKFEFLPDGPVFKRNQMVMVPAVDKDGKRVLGMPLFVEKV